jgi:hypothetical protein
MVSSTALTITSMFVLQGMSAWYGPTNSEEANIGVIHRALELGVTFLDTSDIYGPFTNEELVGGCRHMLRLLYNRHAHPSMQSTVHTHLPLPVKVHCVHAKLLHMLSFLPSRKFLTLTSTSTCDSSILHRQGHRRAA